MVFAQLGTGANIDIERMTPERAGELLAGTPDGDGVELVEMFNQPGGSANLFLGSGTARSR